MTLVPKFIWPDSTFIRAIDADTLEFELSIDVGFGRILTTPVQRLRLAGVDCWPKATPKGKTALELVESACKRSSGHIRVVTLKPYKYGGSGPAAEWMCEAWIPDDAREPFFRSLAQMLLDADLALPYDGRGPRPTEAYKILEA